MDTSHNENDLAVFSPNEQRAIIGHALRDHAFLARCRANIEPQFLIEAMAREVLAYVYDYYDKAQQAQAQWSLQGFKESIHSRFYSARGDLAVRMQYIDSCEAWAKNIDLSLLTSRLTEWLQAVKMRHFFVKGREIFNKNQSAGTKWMRERMKEVEESRFETDGFSRFSNIDEIFADQDRQIERACTTGHPLLDEMMLTGAMPSPLSPDQRYLDQLAPVDTGHRGEASATNSRNTLQSLTKGALLPGESTIVVGALNSGKTSFVLSTVCYNAFFGKRVLFVTTEQGGNKLMVRMLGCMTNMTRQEMTDAIRSGKPERRMPIKMAAEILERQVSHLHYAKAGKMWVESVSEIIRAAHQDAVAVGRPYDLMVIDYPSRLRFNDGISNSDNLFVEKGRVYEHFHLLAKEMDVHVIMPAQTNREGVKRSNSGKDGDVGIADIGTSLQIAQDSDNIIAINRSGEDIAGERIRLQVIKSRSTKTGGTFISKTFMEAGRTHGLDLPAILVPSGRSISNEDAHDLNSRADTVERWVKKVT